MADNKDAKVDAKVVEVKGSAPVRLPALGKNDEHVSTALTTLFASINSFDSKASPETKAKVANSIVDELHDLSMFQPVNLATNETVPAYRLIIPVLFSKVLPTDLHYFYLSAKSKMDAWFGLRKGQIVPWADFFHYNDANVELLKLDGGVQQGEVIDQEPTKKKRNEYVAAILKQFSSDDKAQKQEGFDSLIALLLAKYEISQHTGNPMTQAAVAQLRVLPAEARTRTPLEISVQYDALLAYLSLKDSDPVSFSLALKLIVNVPTRTVGQGLPFGKSIFGYFFAKVAKNPTAENALVLIEHLPFIKEIGYTPLRTSDQYYQYQLRDLANFAADSGKLSALIDACCNGFRSSEKLLQLLSLFTDPQLHASISFLSEKAYFPRLLGILLSSDDADMRGLSRSIFSFLSSNEKAKVLAYHYDTDHYNSLLRSIRDSKDEPIVAMLHYPPLSTGGAETEKFLRELIKQADQTVQADLAAQATRIYQAALKEYGGENGSGNLRVKGIFERIEREKREALEAKQREEAKAAKELKEKKEKEDKEYREKKEKEFADNYPRYVEAVLKSGCPLSPAQNAVDANIWHDFISSADNQRLIRDEILRRAQNLTISQLDALVTEMNRAPAEEKKQERDRDVFGGERIPGLNAELEKIARKKIVDEIVASLFPSRDFLELRRLMETIQKDLIVNRLAESLAPSSQALGAQLSHPFRRREEELVQALIKSESQMNKRMEDILRVGGGVMEDSEDGLRDLLYSSRGFLYLHNVVFEDYYKTGAPDKGIQTTMEYFHRFIDQCDNPDITYLINLFQIETIRSKIKAKVDHKISVVYPNMSIAALEEEKKTIQARKNDFLSDLPFDEGQHVISADMDVQLDAISKLIQSKRDEEQRLAAEAALKKKIEEEEKNRNLQQAYKEYSERVNMFTEPRQFVEEIRQLNSSNCNDQKKWGLLADAVVLVSNRIVNTGILQTNQELSAAFNGIKNTITDANLLRVITQSIGQSDSIVKRLEEAVKQRQDIINEAKSVQEGKEDRGDSKEKKQRERVFPATVTAASLAREEHVGINRWYDAFLDLEQANTYRQIANALTSLFTTPPDEKIYIPTVRKWAFEVLLSLNSSVFVQAIDPRVLAVAFNELAPDDQRDIAPKLIAAMNYETFCQFQKIIPPSGANPYFNAAYISLSRVNNDLSVSVEKAKKSGDVKLAAATLDQKFFTDATNQKLFSFFYSASDRPDDKAAIVRAFLSSVKSSASSSAPTPREYTPRSVRASTHRSQPAMMLSSVQPPSLLVREPPLAQIADSVSSTALLNIILDQNVAKLLTTQELRQMLELANAERTWMREHFGESFAGVHSRLTSEINTKQEQIRKAITLVKDGSGATRAEAAMLAAAGGEEQSLMSLPSEESYKISTGAKTAQQNLQRAREEDAAVKAKEWGPAQWAKFLLILFAALLFVASCVFFPPLAAIIGLKLALPAIMATLSYVGAAVGALFTGIGLFLANNDEKMKNSSGWKWFVGVVFNVTLLPAFLASLLISGVRKLFSPGEPRIYPAQQQPGAASLTPAAAESQVRLSATQRAAQQQLIVAGASSNYANVCRYVTAIFLNELQQQYLAATATNDIVLATTLDAVSQRIVGLAGRSLAGQMLPYRAVFDEAVQTKQPPPEEAGAVFRTIADHVQTRTGQNINNMVTYVGDNVLPVSNATRIQVDASYNVTLVGGVSPNDSLVSALNASAQSNPADTATLRRAQHSAAAATTDSSGVPRLMTGNLGLPHLDVKTEHPSAKA